jgi:hypothetical protein
MEQNKIDKLFQDQLASYEVTPSKMAWEKVERKLDNKISFVSYLKIAAVVVISLSVGLYYWNIPGETKLAVTDGIKIDHPVPLVDQRIDLPERSIDVVTSSSSAEEIKPSVTIEQIPVVNKYPLIAVERIEHEVFDIVEFRSVNVNLNVPEDTRIRIKYFANATTPDKPASKVKLSNIIKYAKENSAVDVLTNIRDAKDNWLDSTLGLND